MLAFRIDTQSRSLGDRRTFDQIKRCMASAIMTLLFPYSVSRMKAASGRRNRLPAGGVGMLLAMLVPFICRAVTLEVFPPDINGEARVRSEPSNNWFHTLFASPD